MKKSNRQISAVSSEWKQLANNQQTINTQSRILLARPHSQLTPVPCSVDMMLKKNIRKSCNSSVKRITNNCPVQTSWWYLLWWRTDTVTVTVTSQTSLRQTRTLTESGQQNGLLVVVVDGLGCLPTPSVTCSPTQQHQHQQLSQQISSVYSHVFCLSSYIFLYKWRAGRRRISA